MTLRGISLNWLVRNVPSQFYPQTWFEREAFACQTYRGTYALADERGPIEQPAAVFIKAWLDGQLNVLNDRYMWTTDVDHNGDPVYIGMAAEYPGMQIHRHLTLDSRWVA